MYSSVTLIRFSLLIFQARLHEVQRRRNVESAHDARDQHTSRPMLRDATSPFGRSLRSQRFVVDSGTPSAAAIFLALKPRVAVRSMAKRSSADRTML